MDQSTRTLFKDRARIMKALAHPTRLYIVETISHQEKCVQELTDLIDADISTVSKHLSVLKNADIVQDEKRGTQVYYRLKFRCVLQFFNCMESVMKSRSEDHSCSIP
jgi:ArsR family transcriptional regulator